MFGKYPRILFFVNGAVPTLEHQLAAERLAPCRVSFRNALLVGDEGSLEECDGVFGDVPKRYADKYPTAEEAIAAFVKTREEQLAKAEEDAAKAKEAAHAANVEQAEAIAAAAKKKADDEAAKAKAAADQAAEAKKLAATASKDAKATAADPNAGTGQIDAAAKAAAAWKPNT